MRGRSERGEGGEMWGVPLGLRTDTAGTSLGYRPGGRHSGVWVAAVNGDVLGKAKGLP